ncbi:MAG: ABC transporter ATP-binding protein [Actinomycetota bacterium]
MAQVALRVKGLSKRYKLGTRQPYRRLGESLVRAVRRVAGRGGRARTENTLWALKDVTFDVDEGEILGIVGANGAGKTTLLRILARITRPTDGRAEIFGRVGSLLEVGTGFHPELTGRENVFLNGAILGMGKREIQRKYDEIVAFSEIEEFMDTPVKHYSSGMRVRLAFSVAAHLEPEILFIDEVLAVGDASFQQKCLGKMEEVASAGRTVVFVSHNMGMITGLCTRAIWIDHGQMRMDASPQEVVEAYLSQGFASDGMWEHPADAECGEAVRILSASVLNGRGEVQAGVNFEDPITVKIEHEVRTPQQAVAIVGRLTDVLGNVILVSQDIDTDSARGDWEPGRYRYTFQIPGSLLRPGRYFLSVQAKKRRGVKLDQHENCLGIDVLPVRFTTQTNRPGVITPMLPWVLEEVPREATA